MATLFLVIYLCYLLVKDCVRGACDSAHPSGQKSDTKSTNEITLDNIILYDILDNDEE